MTRPLSRARQWSATLALVGGLWIVGAEGICWLFGPFRDDRAINLVCDVFVYAGVAMLGVAMAVETWEQRRQRRIKK